MAPFPIPEPSLFMREGDRLVTAPQEDQALASTYGQFPDKGAVHRGFRLTILAANRTFTVREDIHIIHICEAVKRGTELFLMGPKPVYGEFVDGVLATEPPPNPSSPLRPAGPYDGRVLPGPGIDTNYEITLYRFDKPGTHTICWRLGDLSSNLLKIVVTS